MKNTFVKLLTIILSMAAMSSLATIPANAQSNKTTSANTTTGSATASTSISASAAALQTKIQNIITRGDSEITRRLASLNSLSGVIGSSTKLTTADQTALNTEVNNEISGLNSLKTTLDSSTALAAAQSAAQQIISGYRVYALVLPQVHLVQASDKQQQVETKIASLITSLSSRINSSTNSNLVSQLNTLTTNNQAALVVSSNIENSVIAFTPGDYNTDHSLLSQYTNSLKTAQTDNQNDIALAKTLVSDLSTTTTK